MKQEKSPSEEAPVVDEPFCAITNPLTGGFYDLSPLSKQPGEITWTAKGWDYGLNFTLSICSGATHDFEVPFDGHGVKINETTVGGYYTQDSKRVSIGEYSVAPRFVGKKLTMQYDNGSLCPNGKDRKSTLLNFVCDKEIQSKAQISFLGSLHDCAYVFEVRSVHACPASRQGNDYVVLGVFFGIFIVFVGVIFGRNWIYRKLSLDGSSSYTPYNDNTPRWQRVDRVSPLGSVMKKLFGGRAVSALGGRQGIRLSGNGSTDSFFNEIEAQNNLLDSLDAESQ